ncbi:MAG TPA: PIN domain-containing protein [Verrucomicrobiales bacterium]|nr:PIN domain-containing protein [Verrucomicrobiales bacterium]
MFVVDTNILIYAADTDSPEHAKCRDLVESWRNQSTPWHVTWGIVYEFLRVSTHPNVFRVPLTLANAWTFIEAILASPSVSPLTPTERHQAVAAEVFNQIPDIRANLVFDAHTAILMREQGIKTIFTRDTDFNRFPFIHVVDPITLQ